MQVSDLLSQYQNNLASGSEISTGTKGIEQLVETLKQLKPGNIFEGTVNNMKGNQIILGLSSGQNITARIEKGIQLQKGESVFFQVKSNDGTTIQIKPFTMGASSSNPTLLSALDTAGLQVNEKNLNMVNTMMREQMSIDAKSLVRMAKNVQNFSNAQPSTVVEMTKLNLPITAETVQQYENYKGNEGQLSRHLQDFVSVFRGEVNSYSGNINDITSMAKEIFTYVFSENPDVPVSILREGETIVSQGVGKEDHIAANSKDQAALLRQAVANIASSEKQPKVEPTMLELFEKEPVELKNAMNTTLKEGSFELKNLFSETQLNQPASKWTEQFFAVLKSSNYTPEEMKGILQNNDLIHVFENRMKQKFYMSPEKMLQPESVKEYYEELQSHIREFQQLVQQVSAKNSGLGKPLQQMQDNLEFMHHVNQVYAFVQLPVKMANQSLEGQLYVYQKKQKNENDKEELSAFLHFDMEYLGAMDISILLAGKQVTTNWYLASETTLELFEMNLHILSQRLEEKGYHMSHKLQAKEEEFHFVDDFLKKDIPKTSQVHRYSFDVRA